MGNESDSESVVSAGGSDSPRQGGQLRVIENAGQGIQYDNSMSVPLSASIAAEHQHCIIIIYLRTPEINRHLQPACSTFSRLANVS